MSRAARFKREGRHAEPSQGGSILVFVVVITAALLMLAGLTIDGGRLLSARARDVDEAQEAARAGAQALDRSSLHGPTAILDQTVAIDAAQAYLRATGDTGVVTVTGSDVQVTVSSTLALPLLGLAGFGSATVSGNGQARAQRAVPAAAGGGGAAP